MTPPDCSTDGGAQYLPSSLKPADCPAASTTAVYCVGSLKSDMQADWQSLDQLCENVSSLSGACSTTTSESFLMPFIKQALWQCMAQVTHMMTVI